MWISKLHSVWASLTHESEVRVSQILDGPLAVRVALELDTRVRVRDSDVSVDDILHRDAGSALAEGTNVASSRADAFDVLGEETLQ
jgi:hypothetical protein